MPARTGPRLAHVDVAAHAVGTIGVVAPSFIWALDQAWLRSMSSAIKAVHPV